MAPIKQAIKKPSHNLAKMKGKCNSTPNCHMVRVSVALAETIANVVGRAPGHRGEDQE